MIDYPPGWPSRPVRPLRRFGSGVRRVEIDEGRKPGLTADERERLKQLERENQELRRANEILKGGFGFLRGRARRPQELVMFVDSYRDVFGVEPIYRTLQLVPSTYWSAKCRPRSDRSIRDEELKVEIMRVFEVNYRVSGAPKFWS